MREPQSFPRSCPSLSPFLGFPWHLSHRIMFICGHGEAEDNVLFNSVWGLSRQRIHLQRRSHRFNPWVGKIPWRRKWQPPPVFVSGKSSGQRSLVGSSPWDHKESDTTERTRVRSILSESSSMPWPQKALTFYGFFFELRFHTNFTL